jgi:tetratricopeptide (TPR) repeat protein
VAESAALARWPGPEVIVNKNTVIGALVGLVVGGLGGYTLGMSDGRAAAARGGAMAPGMPAGMPPPGMGAPAPAPNPQALQAEAFQRIEINRKLTQTDPKARPAWVALGNDYFDTRQYQKAIEAYERALELDPKDPDVLTDQGVMFQELGQFDRAIANFEKATKLAPTHVQSLFNIGVVQANGKKDPQKAAAAWKKVIEIAPQSPQAQAARQALEQMGMAGK